MHIPNTANVKSSAPRRTAFIFSSIIAFVFVSDTASAQTTTPPDPFTSAGVEARVREYFKDIPVMIPIAKCESGFRQFDSNQQPLHGGTGTMIGVFQIGEEYHRTTAQSLGLNIDTLSGNMAYARYLYERDGTDPWLSSFQCWNMGTAESQPKATPPVTTPATAAPVLNAVLTSLTADMSLGVVNPEVQTLQKILNANGYQLATEGPGSPGNETTKYGALTRDAIRKFQCAQNIVCSGDEGTTGYGFVGKRTRAALLNLGTGTPPPPAAPQSTPTPTVPTASAVEIQSIQNQIDYLLKQVTTLQELLKQKRGY